MSKERVLADQILANIGGLGNINKIVHCMTRLRLGINDFSKIDEEGLKSVDGVLGVVKDETLQIILGPGIVNKVALTLAEDANVKLGQAISVEELEDPKDYRADKKLVEERARKVKEEQKLKHLTPFNRILKSIANIFVPLIPAFVGAGLIGGIGAIFSNMMVAGKISGDGWVHLISISNIIKNGVFFFLVIYVGINAASEFGASPALGGVIGGVTTLTGMNPDLPLKNIFTGNPLTGGLGGVIGVIFAVWLMSFVEKKLREIVPDSLDLIVTPTLTLLVMGVLTIFIIMPLAGFVSNALVGFFTSIIERGGALAGFILGLTFLPMVMFGLHQILTPIHLEMIADTGKTILLPVLAMAGAGQVGAALALKIRLKDDIELNKMIKGALPVGILGIGEPLIYGVTLPLGRPFLTACIGGGIGGAVIAGLGNIGAITLGPSGVALIPLIADGRWKGYVLGLLAAYAGGFIATYFFGIPKNRKEA